MSNEQPIKKRKRKGLSSQHWFCLISLLPIMLVFTYLRILPIIKTFYMSFFKWDMMSATKPFIGLTNYELLLSSKSFWSIFYNTSVIAFSMLLLLMPLSILLANVLAANIRLKGWYEAAYFLPVIMPMVPVTVIWKWILNADYGLLNYFLSFFGVKSLPWLVNPTLAMVSVIIILVWKNLGYNMIIFSVGFKGIPKDYYEAAAIDGATGWKSFWYISLPLLKPITVYVSILTLIKGYNVFSAVYILASDVQGAPGYLVRVMVYDMIENAFRFYKMGYASAEAVTLFVIVFVLTMIQMTMAGDNTESKKSRKKVFAK